MRGVPISARMVRPRAKSVTWIATRPILGKVFTGKDEADKIREMMAGMVPMKRWGMSDEIAKAVLFLAFDATFTTGAELPVDEGWSQL